MYTCENGYQLVGASVRTCLSSGEWSGTPPFCTSKWCSFTLIEQTSFCKHIASKLIVSKLSNTAYTSEHHCIINAQLMIVK